MKKTIREDEWWAELQAQMKPQKPPAGAFSAKDLALKLGIKIGSARKRLERILLPQEIVRAVGRYPRENAGGKRIGGETKYYVVVKEKP